MDNQGHIRNSPQAPENLELSAEELLARVAGGDAESLGHLYDRFSSRLMGLLLRILASRTEAEAVLQEVFLRLWKEARSIAPTGGSVGAWIVLTGRRLALERLRTVSKADGQSRAKEKKTGRGRAGSDKPREARPTLRAPGSLPPGAPPWWLPIPGDIALVDARMGLLHKALGHMPEAQRKALDLAIFDGCTEPEIAERLGEPMGKVGAALRAAFTYVRHRQHAVLGTWTADI